MGKDDNLARQYIRKANAYLPDIEILAKHQDKVSTGMTMLLSHAFECTLKAYLFHSGMTKRQLQNTEGLNGESVNHNLEWLWREAVERGLQVDMQPPDWCARLNELHNRPYYLRYPSEDTMLIVYPDGGTAMSELKTIIDEVDRYIH